MKMSKIKSPSISKNFKVGICTIVLVSSVMITSCKKKTEETAPVETTETTVTNDDAADIVASSVGTGGSGSTSSTSDAAQKTSSASSLPTACMYSLDTTFTRVNSAGSYATYSYNLNYKYQMYCTSSVLTDMVFNLTTSGNLDLPRMSTSSSASGTLTLTGLQSAATSYSANGTYLRSGNATSKVRAKNSFSYQLNLNLSNLSIAKTTYAVQSGSGSVTITAVTSTGKTFNFTGVLTYVNATTATLLIGSKSYTINLPNCEAN
jgi:hypothetical protein